MHYRNFREAKNGDEIVQINDIGQITNTGVLIRPGTALTNTGVLIRAVPGNDYCNGMIANDRTQSFTGACLCDCLHMDDIAAMLKEKGLDKRPAGK